VNCDTVIAGGGPAGLSAAEAIASRGFRVTLVEQNHEIGSPIRTSGGSFVDELDALEIPAHLYHPLSRGRFLSPNNAVTFEYSPPRICVMDVRGVYQYLAARAIAAGATIRLGEQVSAPILQGDSVAGLRTRRGDIAARLTIDATGYRCVLLKQAGLDPGFARFGVGAEYDLYAPHCDPDEAVLIVGDEVAPSGYAWVFPWGNHRVRVGVGVIHPDSRANPDDYLDRLVANCDRWGVDLHGAQPIEHHAGLIPSEHFARRFAGNGILGVGDAVGNASSLLGEGIRWAIEAGRMAGDAAVQALESDDVSRRALERFEQRWRAKHGANLRLAHHINQRIAKWDSAKWDRRLEVLKMMTPDQFVEALKTNLSPGWLWGFLRAHPGLLAKATRLI
jgi:digeranylgeranylglycerophospholipid reductase